MALNLESLMKLGKEVLADMVLDYKDKFDTTLTNINKELTDLRNKFTVLESDNAISKHINDKLSSQLTKVEENVGQTNNIPEGNVWKFQAFLIAFPRMICGVKFVTYFVNAMLILTLSTSKLVID